MSRPVLIRTGHVWLAVMIVGTIIGIPLGIPALGLMIGSGALMLWTFVMLVLFPIFSYIENGRFDWWNS